MKDGQATGQAIKSSESTLLFKAWIYFLSLFFGGYFSISESGATGDDLSTTVRQWVLPKKFKI
jgi:hypothetical protein